jgi:hypothetical protein
MLAAFLADESTKTGVQEELAGLPREQNWRKSRRRNTDFGVQQEPGSGDRSEF